MATIEDGLLRLEAVERAALEDFHAAAGAAAAEDLGLTSQAIGGALVSIATGDPSILHNRTLGLGLTAPATEETIRAIRATYAAAGIERYFVHLHPGAAADAARLLQAQGLRRYRAWMKFRRGRAAPPAVQSPLIVVKIGPEHGPDFAAIVAHGFGLAETSRPALAALPGRPGWNVYIGFDGERAAGCGAMYIKDGVAWYDWAATHPAHRRKGCARDPGPGARQCPRHGLRSDRHGDRRGVPRRSPAFLSQHPVGRLRGGLSARQLRARLECDRFWLNPSGFHPKR